MSGLEIKTKAATLVDILHYRAVTQPQETAYTFLVDGETKAVSLTYAQLERRSLAIAAYLQSFCTPGDRVLLFYPPGLDYIEAFFGCLYAGVIAIPAYPPRPNRSLTRIKSILEDAQANIALTTHSILNNIERRLAHAPELSTLRWLATDMLVSHLAQDWQQPSLTSDTIAFLQYTSGSTAAPKGVILTHHNLLHNSDMIYRYFEHTSETVVVSWLPMYHDMGLIGGVLQPLYGGFPVILMSPLMFLQSPLRWLKAIFRYRATTSGAPNFAYDLCVRNLKPEQLNGLDLSSWDLAFNGAEPINYHTLERFAKTFAPYGFRREAFYPCYGMAEATLIVSGGSKSVPVVAKTVQGQALERNQIVPANPDEDNSRTLVGCGYSLPEQQILIVNPETLTQRQDKEVGEIWLSGSSIAQGYWNQLEETKKTFHAYLADTEKGPFLRTGDLGFIENNELFVTGRLKDVIIINGRNHYPQDIERTVEATTTLLRPNCSATFSVNIEGEERLVVVAEVERRYFELSKTNHESKPEGNVNTAKLIQSIRRAVSENHALKVYRILLLKPNSIPKTSSGKIQRHVCRANFLAGTLAVVAAND